MDSSRPFSIHALCFISLGEKKGLMSVLMCRRFPSYNCPWDQSLFLSISNTYAMLWGFHCTAFVIPQPPISVVILFVPDSEKLSESRNFEDKQPL